MQILRQQHSAKGNFPNLDFDAVVNDIQKAQASLEREPKIAEASDIPDAGIRGGFIDNERTQKTLGSSIRDWAAQQVK